MTEEQPRIGAHAHLEAGGAAPDGGLPDQQREGATLVAAVAGAKDVLEGKRARRLLVNNKDAGRTKYSPDICMFKISSDRQSHHVPRSQTFGPAPSWTVWSRSHPQVWKVPSESCSH